MTHPHHNSQNTESTDCGYFNAVLSGTGYINRMSFIQPKKGGAPYYSVSICILSGKKEGPVRTYINTIVRGREALEFCENNFNAIIEAINNRVPVFGTFEISDLSCETYPKKDSTVGAKMMGRLIGINYLKIGTTVVHQRQKNPVASETSASAPPTPEETAAKVTEPATQTKPQVSQPVTISVSGNGYGLPNYTFS